MIETYYDVGISSISSISHPKKGRQFTEINGVEIARYIRKNYYITKPQLADSIAKLLTEGTLFSFF